MNTDELISKLNLLQKAELCSGVDFWNTAVVKDGDSVLVNKITMSDGPHGLRKQSRSNDHLGIGSSVPSTCFPTAATLANSWDSDILHLVGETIGVEAKALGVDIVLGPGVNIKRNPLGGRNFEYFSEDPILAGVLAGAYINGMQQYVGACIKHYALNSQETGRMYSDSVVDKRAMFELYLKPFEIAIKNSSSLALMTSYNKVNGEYANQNPHLFDFLWQCNYSGLIISDWGGCEDIVKAINCGSNLEMPNSNGVYTRRILQGIKNGELSIETLDRCVEKIIELANKLNADKPNYKQTNINVNDKNSQTVDIKFDTVKHHNIAKQVAQDCIVLLKNNNNVLPIGQESKICIVGDFAFKSRYQGAGSSMVEPTILSSVVDSIKQYNLQVVGTARGFNRYGKKSKSLAKKAIAVGKKCDIILYFLGLDEYSEIEGIDRYSYKIKSVQSNLLQKLYSLNKPIVAILSSGSAVDTSWDKYVDGLLYVGLCGQAGAEAILDVLVGKVNPSGKLSETFANEYKDYPNCNYYPSKTDIVQYRESIFVGYRYFVSSCKDVKYEFGFGLSYSNFLYSDLKVKKDKRQMFVEFNIHNDSSVDGKEVVQLYIEKPTDKVFGATIELKKFAKVFVNANDKVKVQFVLTPNDFEYYDIFTNKYEIAGGQYSICIGSSCRQIKLKQSVELKSTIVHNPYNRQDFDKYFNVDVQNICDKEFEKLLGRSLPSSQDKFVKTNRILVDKNTAFKMLRYSKGWFGRAVARLIRFARFVTKLVGKTAVSNLITMAVNELPIRNLAVFSNGRVDEFEVDGLIMMFNGHFFKGYKMYKKAKKAKKQRLSIANNKDTSVQS